MEQCPGISGNSSADFSYLSVIPLESPADDAPHRIRRNNRVASRRRSQETRTNFLAYRQPPS